MRKIRLAVRRTQRLLQQAMIEARHIARLQDRRGTTFTPAVHALYAPGAAVRAYAAHGARLVRCQRAANLAERVRRRLARLGIEAAAPPEQSAVVLRAYRLPTDLTYTTLHDALEADGFVIDARRRALSNTLFRISTMGDLTEADVDQLLECFAQLLSPTH